MPRPGTTRSSHRRRRVVRIDDCAFSALHPTPLPGTASEAGSCRRRRRGRLETGPKAVNGCGTPGQRHRPGSEIDAGHDVTPGAGQAHRARGRHRQAVSFKCRPIGQGESDQPFGGGAADGDLLLYERVRRDRTEVRDYTHAGEGLDSSPDTLVRLAQTQDIVRGDMVPAEDLDGPPER